MHQYTGTANKVRMKTFDLEVVYCYRTFQQLMLHCYILAVKKLQSVSYRVCPSLLWHPKWMCQRRKKDFLSKDPKLS